MATRRSSEKLLKAGADAKATRWNGETALMIAAGAGSVEEVKMLLDHGADVNGAEPKQLQNALMWAASEGHAEVVDLLIQRGANVNAASKAGFTPLVFATLKNDAPSVQRLLAAGADPNYALPDQTKVLTVAAANSSYAAAIALARRRGGSERRRSHGQTRRCMWPRKRARSTWSRSCWPRAPNPNARTAPCGYGGRRGFRALAGRTDSAAAGRQRTIAWKSCAH